MFINFRINWGEKTLVTGLQGSRSAPCNYGAVTSDVISSSGRSTSKLRLIATSTCVLRCTASEGQLRMTNEVEDLSTDRIVGRSR